jgi:hypothetical protein
MCARRIWLCGPAAAPSPATPDESTRLAAGTTLWPFPRHVMIAPARWSCGHNDCRVREQWLNPFAVRRRGR